MMPCSMWLGCKNTSTRFLNHSSLQVNISEHLCVLRWIPRRFLLTHSQGSHTDCMFSIAFMNMLACCSYLYKIRDGVKIATRCRIQPFCFLIFYALYFLLCIYINIKHAKPTAPQFFSTLCLSKQRKILVRRTDTDSRHRQTSRHAHTHMFRNRPRPKHEKANS